MMTNTLNQYGKIAILLHWIMALIIIGMLTLGLYMTSLSNDAPGKFNLYDWHKAFGVLILGLAILRLVWRFINITPSLSLPKLEKMAARAVHWMLYFFMLAMPISGWLMSSAGNHPVSFFGLFTMPRLIAPNEHLNHLFETTHSFFAYTLIAFIILHIGAALKHYFINKDNILQRMLP